MDAKKLMCKATEIYLLLICTLHLLYVGFSGYSQIFDAKILTFCTINILYFIALAIIFFVYADKGNRLSLTKLSPAHICLLSYLLFSVISGALNTPQSFFGVSRFEGVFTIFFYCFCFFAVSFFPCRKKYILVAFSCAVTVFSLLCTIQLFGYNPLSLYPDGMSFYDAGVRYTTAFIGTIGNTNLCGAFICLALPFFAVILFKGKGKLRFLLLIPIILLTFTALGMGVDSAIIGLLAGVIITIPFILNFRKRGVLIYIITLILLSALALALVYFYPPESGFIYEVSEILHGRISDTFGSGRIRIWKNVISQIPDSPLLGKGPDTMQLEKFPAFERFYPALGKTMKAGIDVAHNEPLNILYHQGILGLIAYLGFVICIIIKWWKNKSDAPILALGIAFICYLVQSLFTFSMCLVAPYFWICAGLIAGLSR